MPLDEHPVVTKTSALRSPSLFLAGWFVVGLLLGLGAWGVWWALVANEALPAQGETLVIPAGTADAIARGEPFAFTPSRISVSPGTRVTLINKDSAEHVIGDTRVPPGATATLETSESGLFSCTVHPSGHMTVTLDSRPPIPAVIAITLGLAFTTAAAAWVVHSATGMAA